MPPFRLFRVADRDSKNEKSLEEFVTDKIVEKFKREQDSPIVRDHNQNVIVKANRSKKHHEVERYLSKIAQIMAEMGKDDMGENQDMILQTLETPTSSHRKLTISSSYLTRALSESEEGDHTLVTTKDPPASNEKDDGDDDDDVEAFSTSDLLKMVKAKLQEYQVSSDSTSSGDVSRDSSTESHGKTVESIIDALSKVKIAMSESQSNNNRSVRSGKSRSFPFSPRTPRRKEKSTISDDAETGATPKRMGLKYKFRSPRPPKSPMVNKKAGSSKTPSTPPSSQKKPPTPKLPQKADTTNAAPVERSAESTEKITCTNSAMAIVSSESKTQEIAIDVVSPELSDSSIEVEAKERCVADADAGVGDSAADVAVTSSVNEKAHSAPSSSVEEYSKETIKDSPKNLKLDVLSPNSQNAPIEVEAKEEVHHPELTSRLSLSKDVDDILKWTDESAVLEVNKELTPRHVPKEGPAWNFLHGPQKKKTLRLRAQKAVQILRKGKSSGNSPTISRQPSGRRLTPTSNAMPCPKPDPPTNLDTPTSTTKPQKSGTFTAEEDLCNYVQTLNEMEEYIKDADGECEGVVKSTDSVETREDVATCEAKFSRQTTSDRLDKLFPALEATETAEVPSVAGSGSVACSRTTVPTHNRSKHKVAPVVPPQKPSTQPTPIIEFEEEQLESYHTESFTTYGTSAEEDDTTIGDDDTKQCILSDDSGFASPRKSDVISPSQLNNLEMSFSRSLDSYAGRMDRDSDLDEIRSLSDLSAVVLEETSAVARELSLDMKGLKKWFCF